ncbi:MAG TPA: dephospho-CoA kinase [Gemmataceae bacterium]|nr:dephospho-CoA kinase [Gemmataceae bacterium]
MTKPVVGLIGGMGSGKSLVAAALARYGAKVISGDQLGHEALRQPEIRERVIDRWGSGTLDAQGAIDRHRLAKIVFSEPAERRILESMVFPWIQCRLREEIASGQADQQVPLIVLDAAIMLEAGWSKDCDRLVYVDTPREVRLQRLTKQRGWSVKDVEARENAQLLLTDKKKRADYVVDNGGSPEQLNRQIADLLKRWGIVKEEQ